MANYSLNKKQSKSKNLWIFIFIMIFVILIAVFIADENRARNEYLKDITVNKAMIAEKASENDKYYVRINVNNPEQINLISTENSWFEVDRNYYFYDAKVGSEVGVLLGNYDIFKDKLFGKGQRFEKSVWGIQDLYKTYEAAQQANPYKKYSSEALLKKKKAISNGTKFFVVEADQRVFNLEVDKDIYDKYNENQKVECEFEALGDFVKILGVKG